MRLQRLLGWEKMADCRQLAAEDCRLRTRQSTPYTPVPTTTLERAFRVGGIGVGGKFSGSKELENLPTISDTTYIFPAIGLSVMAVLIYKNNGLIGVTL